MIGIIFPDIPRLYTGIAEWLACILYINLLPKRFSRKIFIPLLLITGVIQVILQILAGTFPLFFWISGMLLNILWMFITIMFLSKTSFHTILFMVAKAFIVAEMTAAIAWQSYCYILIYSNKNSEILQFILISMIYLLLYSIINLVEKYQKNQFIPKIIQTKEVIISLLIGIIIFSVGNIGFLMTISGIVTSYDSNTIFIIRSLVNISGFLLLYTQEQHIVEIYLQNELTAIQNVVQNQYEQYLAFNENSELIKKKVHDLKHQLYFLKNESNELKKTSYIKEMEEMIQNFEAKIETGNAVLDTVLTRKNQYCIQHQINFTCLVQGELLEKIDTIDLCTLFGNALDNAIEAVEKINEIDKKLITLKVTSKSNFIIIRLSNYFEDEINFQNNQFPTTSKQNKEYHGYGLKSMEYIVQKYNGNINFKQQNKWIHLTILLPKI